MVLRIETWEHAANAAASLQGVLYHHMTGHNLYTGRPVYSGASQTDKEWLLNGHVTVDLDMLQCTEDEEGGLYESCTDRKAIRKAIVDSFDGTPVEILLLDIVSNEENAAVCVCFSVSTSKQSEDNKSEDEKGTKRARTK